MRHATRQAVVAPTQQHVTPTTYFARAAGTLTRYANTAEAKVREADLVNVEQRMARMPEHTPSIVLWWQKLMLSVCWVTMQPS